jgi:hypothetical protein
LLREIEDVQVRADLALLRAYELLEAVNVQEQTDAFSR